MGSVCSSCWRSNSVDDVAEESDSCSSSPIEGRLVRRSSSSSLGGRRARQRSSSEQSMVLMNEAVNQIRHQRTEELSRKYDAGLLDEDAYHQLREIELQRRVYVGNMFANAGLGDDGDVQAEVACAAAMPVAAPEGGRESFSSEELLLSLSAPQNHLIIDDDPLLQNPPHFVADTLADSFASDHLASSLPLDKVDMQSYGSAVNTPTLPTGLLSAKPPFESTGEDDHRLGEPSVKKRVRFIVQRDNVTGMQEGDVVEAGETAGSPPRRALHRVHSKSGFTLLLERKR